MIILHSLKKPTLKYPLLGCLSVCLVSELRARRSVVVTECSSQFLAAYVFRVLFFKLKPRKVIPIIAIGADEKVVVFDDRNAQGEHLFSKTIERCFLILMVVELVDFVFKFNQLRCADR